MGLGQIIRKLRTAKGWTLDALEERSGVAGGTIHALEVRDSSRSQYFPALAEALEIPFPMLYQAAQEGELPRLWTFGDRIFELEDDSAGRPTLVERTPGHAAPPARPTSYPSMRPILAWEHETDLPEGEFVMVPRLDVRLSAGHGTGGSQVEIEFNEKQPQAFRADWIRSEHLKPKKLAAMKADGDSMEQRIQHGDALVIDTSQTEVRDDRVYAIWYDGGERVKRLYRLPGGGLRIHSDNPKYPDLVLKPDELDQVRIIGRVVHTGGTGGL